MDIKAYIASGILEQYVLGLVSDTEARQVEQYAQQYPEIRAELDSIEEALTSFAQADALKMPSTLPGKILDHIDQQANTTSSEEIATPSKSKTGSNGLLFILALIGLALLAGLIYFSVRLNEVETELSTTRSDLVELQAECATKDSEIEGLRAQLRIMRTQGNQQIFMLGTDNAPNAIATVHYNTTQEAAYLDVIDLPAPPTNKQYQLWAIVDGQPVDMGVFDNAIGVKTFEAVPFIANAQAFAVTVEDIGGSPTPSLETLVVIGNVS